MHFVHDQCYFNLDMSLYDPNQGVFSPDITKEFSNVEICFSIPGVRPFSCSLCGKRFSRKNGLKEHKQTHIEIQRNPEENLQYQCPVCLMKFLYRSRLLRHINGIHKDIGKYTVNDLRLQANVAQCCAYPD